MGGGSVAIGASSARIPDFAGAGHESLRVVGESGDVGNVGQAYAEVVAR